MDSANKKSDKEGREAMKVDRGTSSNNNNAQSNRDQDLENSAAEKGIDEKGEVTRQERHGNSSSSRTTSTTSSSSQQKSQITAREARANRDATLDEDLSQDASEDEDDEDLYPGAIRVGGRAEEEPSHGNIASASTRPDTIASPVLLEAELVKSERPVVGTAAVVVQVDEENNSRGGLSKKWKVLFCVVSTLFLIAMTAVIILVLQPTDPPTISPTETPTTFSPSTEETTAASPSASPSTLPTFESAPCDDLDLQISCVPPVTVGEDIISCFTIPALFTPCVARPFQMTLRYTGGDCLTSFNSQSKDHFQCEDLNGGPTGVDPVFVIVANTSGTQIYYSGVVQVGGLFQIQTIDGRIPSTLAVFIYNPGDFTDIVAEGNLRQTVVFVSSCAQILFLADRFGSLQVVEYSNDEQGQVTLFHNVTMEFRIAQPTTTVDAIELTTLSGQITRGLVVEDYNLDSQVQGTLVTQGENPILAELQVTLDLAERTQYKVNGRIVGFVSPQHNNATRCTAEDEFVFTVGNP